MQEPMHGWPIITLILDLLNQIGIGNLYWHLSTPSYKCTNLPPWILVVYYKYIITLIPDRRSEEDGGSVALRWKFMSCSHCQELRQQTSWLLIGCTKSEQPIRSQVSNLTHSWPWIKLKSFRSRLPAPTLATAVDSFNQIPSAGSGT